MKLRGVQKKSLVVLSLMCGLLLVASGPSAAMDAPAGVAGDICAGGAGGFGEPDITGAEAISYWRGEWDLVKLLEPQDLGVSLNKVCICLTGSSYTPTVYDLNIVAYANDGPDGKPGTRVLSLPVRATLDRSRHDYVGFDLGQAAFNVEGPLYVGVHSRTNGPQDQRQIFVCQFPRGTGMAPSYYRLPNWAGDGWISYIHESQIGSQYQIGVRANFAEPSSSPAERCTRTATTGCVTGGRFKVEAEYRTAQNPMKAASIGDLGSDTAYLTFFREGNAEALVKVLDGCAINGHHWVFIGGLTNIEANIRVTDTVTGQSKTYSNPAGNAFRPVQDVRALPCN